MRIPSQLKIGGHIYRVVRREMDGKCGETNYNEQVIVIDSELHGSGEAATLIHEAMHVMNSTLDHTLLDSLSEQLFQFLSDNGLLANGLDNF